MNWKTWIAQSTGMLWIVSVTMFLIVAGWLLHIIEAMSQGIVKNKKAFNKKAVGSGTIAELVAKPVHKYSQRVRKIIQKYISNHCPLGKWISQVV